MIIHTPTYNNVQQTGGKAKGLYMLRSAGFAVPDFFVIAASTFDDVVNNPKEENVESALLHFELSTKDKDIIDAILQQWTFPRVKLIVRSSVTDEDGQHNSFAGMMDSYPHIDSVPLLFEKIKAVAASAYSVRAMHYRKERNIQQKARPAVIVQMQVAATVSGVMFSTWPQYPQELAIHAVNGFGEQLMNGALQADEYYFLKKNANLNRKRRHDETTTESLNAAQLKALYNAATKLEQICGAPQDIEFVYGNNDLYIVQCRPITQPIPAIIVYDNSNIQESYCGVTTPLTFSFAQKAYTTVYNQSMEILHLPANQIAALQPVVNNLLGLLEGRIYYNINNWYKGLQLLPSFRQNKADMERMMGVLEPVDFIEDRQRNFLQKIKLLPQLMSNLVFLLSAFRKLKVNVPAFLSNFRKHYSAFYSKELVNKNNTKEQRLNENIPQQLLSQLEWLDKNLLKHWTTPIVNDFYVMMNNGRVQRLLNKTGMEDVDAFISHYLSGNQDIASAQPAIAMQVLATQAVKEPQLNSLILLLPADIHQQVEKKFPNFFSSILQYIELYGDRTIGELKLETITMREDPFVLYKYLKNIVITANTGHAEKTGVLRAEAQKRLDDLLDKKPRHFKKRVYSSLDKLQKGIQYREAMRLERTRMFGMYRRIFLAAGNWLYYYAVLESERDVFYLELNELTDLLGGRHRSDIKDVIASRKKTFAGHELIEMPSRLEVPSPPKAMQHDDELQKEYTLKGTGCVPGIVTGEAIVVNNTFGDLEVHGKIIVAERTDPGWAVLFPSCKAVLISKGSSLSHSVILLREFGIPAIINIPKLMKRIHTGMQITIDGTTGEINIISHEKS